MKLNNQHIDFVTRIQTDLRSKNKHNKTSIEKLASQYNIKDKTEVKELTELAIVNECRTITENDSFTNQEKFELLYSKWIDNSINKEFADKIFYIKESNEFIGFVTVKNSDSFSTIGLIAVSENYQGKGIGRKLLSNVEKYCISENIFLLYSAISM